MYQSIYIHKAGLDLSLVQQSPPPLATAILNHHLPARSISKSTLNTLIQLQRQQRRRRRRAYGMMIMMQLRGRAGEERRGPRGRMEGKTCRCGAGGGVFVFLAVLVLTLALLLQGAAARASPCSFRVLGGGGGRPWALSFSPPPWALRAAWAWRGGASRASSRICSMATTAQEVRKEGVWGVIAARRA